MAILIGDYIQGIEHYGTGTHKTKGWVNSIRTDGEFILYDIRADDGWKGARGTMLTTELGRVIKLDENTGEPVTQNTGFSITCDKCGEAENFSVHGVSGYGVEIECNNCGNTEEIFW